MSLGEFCVRHYVDPTDEAKVPTYYGEGLPTMTHYFPTKSPFDYLALVVHCETVAAEDVTQLMHDVWIVLLVVPDEHGCDVGSARNIVGGEWWEGIMRSHVYLTFGMR